MPFLVKLHAFKLSSIFPLFLLMFVGWTTRSKFCLVSSAVDGMDLLKTGPVNAYEMAFKIDEAMWKTFKSDCAVSGQEKSKRKFLKLA